MASNPIFYTTGIGADAIVSDITSEATGFPKEYLIDNNPDSYWKPSSSADQYIKFNLGAAKTVYAICLFIKDYLTLDSAVRCYLHYATTNEDMVSGSWTGFSNPIYTLIGNKPLGPLRMIDFTSPASASAQYWRLKFTNLNEAIKVSGVWFCVKRSMTIGNLWPEPDKHIFANRSVGLEGGRRFASGINKSQYVQLERTFKLCNAANFAVLQNAFLDSFGSRHPVIFQEGATYDTARLVYFDEDIFDDNQIDYLIYNPTIRMTELPYIRDGDNY